MRRRTLRITISVIGACTMVLLSQLAANALDVSGTPSPVTGNATWFSGLGRPYGGCGLPQANVVLDERQNLGGCLDRVDRGVLDAGHQSISAAYASAKRSVMPARASRSRRT